jgi:hypothetical protein
MTSDFQPEFATVAKIVAHALLFGFAFHGKFSIINLPVSFDEQSALISNNIYLSALFSIYRDTQVNTSKLNCTVYS